VVINGRFLLNSYGGARRFAIELTERLSRIRGDILLVTPPLPGGTQIPDVPHKTVGRFSGPVWEQIELPLWLRAHGKPLLLNPATIAPFFYSRQITVAHDIAPAMRPQDFTPLFRLQWHLAVRLGMLRRGQRLVTISRASQREIAEQFGIDPARIDVVYAGADSFVTSESPAPETMPSATFLVFGRHGANKNIRTVIDAARELPDGAGIRVRLIGKLDPALQPYAAEKNVPDERLDWRGPVTDAELAQEYREAVGFIWPSLHEGFGIPSVEAQSLGLPVIASDIPINREVLGDAAVYFPPEEHAALAARMIELVSDPDLRAALRERGTENAQRFTWENTARGWDELIRREHG
jgi:glycosyltransferase involved in cell wall biosynthesis